jgi:hypothetical protein
MTMERISLVADVPSDRVPITLQYTVPPWSPGINKIFFHWYDLGFIVFSVVFPETPSLTGMIVNVGSPEN